MDTEESSDAHPGTRTTPSERSQASSKMSKARKTCERGPKKWGKNQKRMIDNRHKEFEDPRGETLRDAKGKILRAPEYGVGAEGVIIGPDGHWVLDAEGNPLFGQQKTYDGPRAETASQKSTGAWTWLLVESGKSARMSEAERRIYVAQALAASESSPNGRGIVKRPDGTRYCTLCEKVADGKHEQSSAHFARVEEDALTTAMVGVALGARRFQRKTAGCPGKATKKNLMAFWGDALPNLPQVAMERLDKMGVLYADGRECYPIHRHEVRGFRLAIVSYSGSGKYTAESKFAWYDELPDSDEVIHMLPPTSCRRAWTRATGDGPQLPQGHGWWPVVAPTLTDAAAARFTGWIEIDNLQKTKGILVICIYQLLDDGRIVGWWIFIDV
jgi:hypothetical protein